MARPGLLPAAASALLAACAPRVPAPEARPADGRAARAADAAFDAAVAARDRAAFAARVCADAVFGGRARLHQGREAVVGAWAALLDPGGPALRWVPEAGGEARSGDLAWTTGRWTIRGEAGESRGAYATVWRREGEGWCALLDLGLEPPGPLAARARRPLRRVRSAAGDLEAEVGLLGDGSAVPAAAGAYLAVRRRPAAGWETLVESAVAFRP